MKNPTKAHQAIIQKIDHLSATALIVYRDAISETNIRSHDYARGAFCGYQLSIMILACDLPDFASNAFSGRPPSFTSLPSVQKSPAPSVSAPLRLCVEKESEAA